MDTALCKTFLAVARCKSFSGAAIELHVVQSTVTSRVQALESQLGVRLLDRLPGGARLTDDGERLAEYAQDLLDAENRLIASVAADATPSGDVFLGAPESVCAYRLPAVIADLARSYPGIAVHLSPTGTAETFNKLLSKELHLGLVLDDRPVSTHLTAIDLGREVISLVASAQNAATTDGQTLHELAAHPFFLLEEGCSYSDSFLAEVTQLRGSRPQVTRFGSIEAVRACVLAGLGLSVLPDIAIAADPRSNRLVPLADHQRPGSPLRIVADSRRSRSPASEAVVAAIRTAAKRWYPLVK